MSGTPPPQLDYHQTAVSSIVYEYTVSPCLRTSNTQQIDFYNCVLQGSSVTIIEDNGWFISLSVTTVLVVGVRVASRGQSHVAVTGQRNNQVGGWGGISHYLHTSQGDQWRIYAMSPQLSYFSSLYSNRVSESYGGDALAFIYLYVFRKVNPDGTISIRNT